MKYRQTYRVPAKTLHAWNGSEYRVEQASTETIYSALNDAQAFRIGQSIAKKNGWVVSGQPVKIN